MADNIADDFVPIGEAAESLGISVKTLRQKARRQRERGESFIQEGDNQVSFEVNDEGHFCFRLPSVQMYGPGKMEFPKVVDSEGMEESALVLPDQLGPAGQMLVARVERRMVELQQTFQNVLAAQRDQADQQLQAERDRAARERQEMLEHVERLSQQHIEAQHNMVNTLTAQLPPSSGFFARLWWLFTGKGAQVEHTVESYLSGSALARPGSDDRDHPQGGD